MPSDESSKSPRPSVYGRNYSYFSHRIFVVFMPEEMHRYLDERLELVASLAGEPATESDKFDKQLVRWVLLHRSQLNALALNRLLESWRGDNDFLAIPTDLRSDPQYLMDITLQVALELQLADAMQSPMLHSRPRLMMALIDAAYFVSRQRLEIDRHPGSGNESLIDLSSNGLSEFRSYLVQRMNLEDDRRKSRPLGVGAATSFEALSAEEVKWLQGVAAGVAKMLTPASSMADFVERWRSYVAPRWRKLGLEEPDQALFDALLVGSKAPLEELPIEGATPPSSARPTRRISSLRFRWRQSAFPQSAWHKSLAEIVAESRSALRCIRAIEGLLRRAMSPSAPEAAAADGTRWRPLRDLADRYRLLPTSPSWSSVEQAMSNLQRATKGVGTIDEVYRDGQLLRDYAAMICRPESAEVVREAMQLAALLAGLQARHRPGTGEPPNKSPDNDRPTFPMWEDALLTLSDGLRCNEVDLPDVASRLRKCRVELSQVLPLLSEPTPVRGPKWSPGTRLSVAAWRSVPSIPAAVRQAYLEGRRQPELWGTFVSQAWKTAAERAGVLAAQSRTAPPCHASEILCQMFAVGPARFLPLRLERATYRQWTRVAAHALRDFAMDRSHDEDLVLPQLAAHALERCGIRALDHDLQQHLLASWGSLGAHLRDYVESRRLWAGLQTSFHVAVVIGPRHGSMTDAWSLPPREGLVLAAMDGELDLLERLVGPGWTRDLPEPPHAAIEPLPIPSVSRVEHWLLERLGQPPRLIWLTRASQPIEQHPQLVEPKSADELWDSGDLPQVRRLP